MAYLVFNQIPFNGKTKKFEVRSHMGDFLLGEIKWRSGWRKYVFETSESVFDVKCLDEIIEFINNISDERANRK